MKPAPTPDPERVRSYFDAQARKYATRSTGGVWQHVRARESRAVFDLLRPAPGEVVLDAGSGAGHYSVELLRRGAKVTALDFSAPMLEALRQDHELDTLEGDLATVALPPRFDKVLCAGALEFVPDPAAALANLTTALRPEGPGGIVLLLPRRGWSGAVYRRFHRGHGFTVNLFAREEVERLVETAAPGFGIDTLRSVTFNFVLLLRRDARARAR